VERLRKIRLSKRAIRQIPNAITVLRILLIPLVIVLLFRAENAWELWLAVLFFTISAATDGLDGAIARRKDLISKTGQLLDPIADKALLGASLITLSALGFIGWAPTVIILVRELAVTLYRLAVAKKRVIAASGGGKFKTVVQSIAIPFVMAPLEFLGSWIEFVELGVIWFAVAVTVWTGLDFFRKQIGR